MNVNFKLDQDMPLFLPYPKFLITSGLNLTAREVYALLFHRTTLSKLNGWTDKEGNVYIIYPLAELAKDLGCSVRTVTRALKSLVDADLIDKRHTEFCGVSRIFLKMPR